ncbi:hypothetical protein V2J09_003810 [Rumex salicifolius]
MVNLERSLFSLPAPPPPPVLLKSPPPLELPAASTDLFSLHFSIRRFLSFTTPPPPPLLLRLLPLPPSSSGPLLPLACSGFPSYVEVVKDQPMQSHWIDPINGTIQVSPSFNKESFWKATLLHNYSPHHPGSRTRLDSREKMEQFNGASPGRISVGCIVFDGMPERNVVSWTAIIAGLCGKLDYALTLFRRMRTPDVVSWTTVIATYVQIGKETIANREFLRMIELNIRPNEYTFAAIISGCSDLKWGEQLHNQVTKVGLMDSLSVSNSVMTMYSKSGLLCSSSMVFDAMSRRDVVSWSTIISGYCQGGLAEEAFQLLSQMRREGPKPTEFAFSSVLSVCGQMAILEQGRQLHAHVLTLGVEQTPMIQSALINMYAKCGSIQEASEIFKVTKSIDIISWTAMINGYAEHGRVQEAVDLFERIPQAGLKPDSVTFIGILTACSHAGLVDLGYRYFDSMKNKYHISPYKEHYGCMIDLLCRAGRLNEAENMINDMPFEQDDVVWSTLLRACRIQGDIERGRRAAEKILELNPNCAGTHITLSNVYSVRGKWREAAEIRRAMKAKGVIKEPGSSWIKVKDRVSAFVSGDRTHPEGESLYGILELLVCGEDMASHDIQSILCGEQD